VHGSGRVCSKEASAPQQEGDGKRVKLRVDARRQHSPHVRDVRGLQLERLRRRKARGADLQVVVQGLGVRVRVAG